MTAPDSKDSRPFRQRRNVLLPLPEGPMIAATSSARHREAHAAEELLHRAI